jgi:hypothetical protein
MIRNFKKWLLSILLVLVLAPSALGTISSTTNRVSYTGNGAVDTYSYTFIAESDLLVTVRDDQTPATETTLTLTTHYTVTGEGLAAGGTVVLVNGAFDWLDADGDLESNYVLTIRRVRPLTQTTSIRNQGAYYPALHENAFDHLVMIGQQLDFDLDRCIKKSETDEVGELFIPLEDDRVSTLFGWDASGDPEAVSYTAAVSTGGGLLAANNLSDVANVATARSNLGADAAHWNASELEGVNVASAAPAAGQLLVFDGTDWAPADPGPSTGGYTAPVETTLANGQAAAADVTGMNADCADYSSVEFLVEIHRHTDAEHRVSVGRLAMWCHAGAWSVERGLFNGAADGVTFSVSTVGTVGQVQYTSDTIAGANYAGEIKFGRFSFPQ